MTYFFNDILLPWSLLVAVAAIMFVLRKSHDQWQDLALAWALAAIGTIHIMIAPPTTTPSMLGFPIVTTTMWVFPLAAILVLRCVIGTTMAFMWPGVAFALYLGAVGFMCFDGLTMGIIMVPAIIILLTSLHLWARTYMWCLLAKPLTGWVCGASVAVMSRDNILLFPVFTLCVVLAIKLISDPYEPSEPEEEMPQPVAATPPPAASPNASNRWHRRYLGGGYTRLVVDTVTVKIADSYQRIFIIVGIDKTGAEQALGLWPDTDHVWEDIGSQLRQRGVTAIPTVFCLENPHLKHAIELAWPGVTVRFDDPTPQSRRRSRALRQAARSRPHADTASMMDALRVALYDYETKEQPPTGRRQAKC